MKYANKKQPLRLFAVKVVFYDHRLSNFFICCISYKMQVLLY